MNTLLFFVGLSLTVFSFFYNPTKEKKTLHVTNQEFRKIHKNYTSDPTQEQIVLTNYFSDRHWEEEYWIASIDTKTGKPFLRLNGMQQGYK